jgi:tRNA(Ile)-lysidine synthase
MFEKNAQIAVAVSGGPDSMALLHLLHSISKNVIAVTVDHGLRADSGDESAMIADWCKKNKIDHQVFKWQGTKPKTALHETARAARYNLLEEFCYQKKILHLATAHHADDNAETILQRLAKASGVQGLAGMQEHSFSPHLHLWRPLLPHRKSELVAYCDYFKIPYVRDPSNEHEKYARGRLRRVGPLLAAEGLTVKNLNLLAEKQRLAAVAIADQGLKFLSYTTQHPGAHAKMRHDMWCQLPEAAAAWVIERSLKLVSGIDVPLRYESLANLCAALRTHGFRAKTLGHCRIILKKDYVHITPES